MSRDAPGMSTAVTQGPELRAAYAACRRMQRRHDPTYYWATQRLPREIRPAVHALYGFVRGADELVDGPHRPARPVERRAALDAWEQELERGLDSGRSAHPVIAALVDAGRRHDLPLRELRVYMASMRVDCGPVRIETREELDRYMRGSAGAVGLIMAPLLGAPERSHDSFARLGTAFQLTNFVRDVREDYALDRLYLPREELERFGAREEEIATGRPTGAFRAALASEVSRARRLFAETAPAVAAAPARIRPAMRLARSVYLRTLGRIEANGFDVLGRPSGLRPWEFGAAAMRSLGGQP